MSTITARRQRRRLTLFFILAVALIFIVTMLVELAVAGILLGRGILDFDNLEISDFSLLSIFLSSSVIMGTAISFLIGRIILKPIDTLINSMKELAAGHYDTRINLGKQPMMQSVTETFNLLAKELQNTEILRADFVNNFSHEFNTPIVSIYGFAKLLSRNDISQEQRADYLKIIEEESKRLSNMATNVLNLAKIEKQSILTNKTTFNLSEQLRSCILIFEKRWSAKELDINADFDEVNIYADEQLLYQVWINLLDNAIKFADQGTILDVTAQRNPHFISVSITNCGISIGDEDKQRIFAKFYQADKSRGKEGNGIGLPIVKRIVSLHQGKIDVACSEGRTTFTVTLPQ